MADRRLLYTSLLLCLIHYYGNTVSVAPVLSFNPQSPLQLTYNETQSGAGRQLAITCRQPAGGSIVTMELSKNSTSGVITTTRLLYAANTVGSDQGTSGLAVLETGLTGATASGNITSNTDRYITLTYTAASCDNGGTYICTSTVLTAGSSPNERTPGTLLVTVSPGQADITVVPVTGPSGSAWYLVGDEVTFQCTVNVGTVETTALQEITFFWQYEVDDGSGSGMKVFQDYPNPLDIDNSRPGIPSVGQKCQTMTRTSILKRNLTIDDQERRYKCFVSKAGTSYEALAGIYPGIDVRESGAGTNPGQQTGGAAKADVGMIVGIIIAILVVIAVVVVIVVFVIRHQRQKEQEGAYEPEKPAEPPVMSVPPPYTSEPPRFSRNDKPRGGHTNKAMDDEHDGKEPEKEKERSKHRDRGDRDPDRERRYDARPPRQEFEAGRRNPGFERNVDDPRGRRYSSDDGGTDVNRSISLGEGDHTIGSAV